MTRMVGQHKSEWWVNMFRNLHTNQTHSEIYDLIDVDTIKNASLSSHEKNISNYFLRPDKYSTVIKGLYPIPPKSVWVFNSNTFNSCNESIIKTDYCPNQISFFQSLERQLQIIKHKKIGVELSGGLDTAIIIGLLKYFNNAPILVGSTSSKYEFRTEALIQKYFIKDYNNSNYSLIDKNSVLPFTKLKNTPLHQLPSSTSLYYYFANEIAGEFKKMGTNIVLSGMGLDLLLCEHPNPNHQNVLTNPWHTWMLDDNWFNEYIYNKKGIVYKSGAASQLIIKSICSLRQNEIEDVQKKWARIFFKQLLPTELTNYYYKADNSGEFLDGLWKAKNDIVDLYKFTYNITKFQEFNTKSLNAIFDKVHLSNETKDKQILGHISFANWVYSLFTNSLLKV